MNKAEKKLLCIFIASTPYFEVEEVWGYSKKEYNEIYKKYKSEL